MFDSKKIEKYLINNSQLLGQNCTNIEVSNLKRVTGGVTNELFSFSVFYSEYKKFKKSLNLILKIYRDNSFPPAFNSTTRRYLKEFEVLTKLNEVGFPVPQAYFCEHDSSYLGYPFIVIQNETILNEKITIDCFANTLANLHNLSVDKLGIVSLLPPEDNFAFARQRLFQLKESVSKTRHNCRLKKDFDFAIKWLEHHVSENKCPKYCLIHGEYHPEHTLITSEGLKVIDWESVEIGDPAFDVGYAYNMVKLMYNDWNVGHGQNAAEEFVETYQQNQSSNIIERLLFYKVVGILEIAIDVSSWMSNPLAAYRRFGKNGLVRAIVFPLAPYSLFFKNWLNSDFLISCLQYFQDFVKTLK